MIRKYHGKYALYSKTSHRRLGIFPSRAKAEQREKQIQYFKFKKLKGGYE